MEGRALERLLQSSLALWGVEGEIEAASATGNIVVRAHGGAVVSIVPAPSPDPFRWYVQCIERERAAGALPSDATRSRPCGSLVGVLSAFRRALGIERGHAAQVVPSIAAAPNGVRDIVRKRTTTDERDPGPLHGAAQSPRSEVSAAVDADEARIPITVLTGFLGSGKTTLLGALLRHAAMARTAVIVNEFGEIGLDHELIETGDESFVQLSTGCLCCQVRSDLVLTLGELAFRRERGELPAFDRVVMETSGLADPAPILQALMSDPTVTQRYALAGVVTTVDASTALVSLQQHAESARQVAIADTLVLTKTDLPQADIEPLVPWLERLNPGARRIAVVRGAVAPDELFGPRVQVAPSARRRMTPIPSHAHSEGITSVSVVREQPLHAVTLALFVSALAENLGSDLLRLKGIVGVTETPEQPAVIHGVQHLYAEPAWLSRWPSRDRRTRIVLIGKRIAPEWVRLLLDLLDQEVSDRLARP